LAGTSAINGPVIIAAEKVLPDGTEIKVFNATVTRESEGEYQVTFVAHANVASIDSEGLNLPMYDGDIIEIQYMK